MTVRILTGDCRLLLKTLADESVDCIIADPPYGDTSLWWDERLDGWQPELRRVLKPTGSMWVFGSMRFFMASFPHGLRGWTLAQDLVWEKHNGSSFHADRFKRVHEHIVQFYHDDAPWAGVFKSPVTTPDATARTVRRKKRPPHTGHIEADSYTSEDGGPRLMRSVIFERSCHGYAIHPTQKPEGIVEPLLRYSCPPGGVVLDPFAGSGTTGAVAKRLSLEAILIEIDADYAAAARMRVAGGPLFAKAAE